MSDVDAHRRAAIELCRTLESATSVDEFEGAAQLLRLSRLEYDRCCEVVAGVRDALVMALSMHGASMDVLRREVVRRLSRMRQPFLNTRQITLAGARHDLRGALDDGIALFASCRAIVAVARDWLDGLISDEPEQEGNILPFPGARSRE